MTVESSCVPNWFLCDVETSVSGAKVALSVRTDYPATGGITVTVVDCPARPLEISLRIPRWAGGVSTVDGAPVAGDVARVRRTFRPGEEIRFAVAMTPRFTIADPLIDAVRACVAVERGPLVHCAESVDLPDGLSVADIAVDPTRAPVDSDGRVLASFTRVDRPPHSWPYSGQADAGVGTLAGTGNGHGGGHVGGCRRPVEPAKHEVRSGPDPVPRLGESRTQHHESVDAGGGCAR